MRALLVSTYDLGRQPFGLASPAAWLRARGVEVTCADLSRAPLSEPAVRAADVVAFFLPMHTASRLALPVVDRVRALNPAVRLCAYGLYAPLNAALLRARGVTHILGGEFEAELLDVITGAAGRSAPMTAATSGGTMTRQAPRLRFRVPDRSGLPPPDRYATLHIGASRRVTGYTEASRGCKHRCRHCPIVPVYDGQFRIVPVDVVVADIAAQVDAGARHITFGDPDFFNGIGHARAVLAAFASAFPGITCDVTIKVEHLRRHAADLGRLRDAGCAFVTTAVESFDDGVLEKLRKGHTAADFEAVLGLCRSIDLPLAPTFVAFTPWTTPEGYCAMLQEIDRLELVESVAPVQFAIRLLVTQGSGLLELADVRRLADRFDEASLTFPWRHPDLRVDALQQRIAELVGDGSMRSRAEIFARLWEYTHDFADAVPPPRTSALVPRATIPYLDEPWYC